MALPKLYDRIIWHNDTTPAINEDNLNAMSKGLDDVDDRLIDLAGTIMEDVPQIIEDMEILGPAIENIDSNVTRAETAADNAEADALVSEGYALGTQDGVEVTSGEYYQNNAKYYANIANPPIENTVDFTDIITISDAINKAAKDVRLKVEAVQDLHGYNNPWVGGAGKNYALDIDLSTWSDNQRVEKGITYTLLRDNAGNIIGINMNGATSNDYSQIGFGQINLEANVQYYMDKGDYSNTSVLFYINLGASSGSANCTSAPVTPTYNAAASNVNILLFVPPNTTVSNYTITPLICKNSESDKSFAPYTNICPISGWDNAKVTRGGKNLLENNLASGTTQASVVATVQSDKKVVLNGLATGDAIFVLNNHCILPKGLLKLTGNPSKGYLSALKYNSSGYMGVVYNDSGSGVIMDTSNDADDVYYVIRIVVYVLTGQLTNATYEPMISIEGGEYEPYKETVEFTISLNGTRYGGTLDVTSGVLTVTDANIASYNGESLPSTWMSDRDVYTAGGTPTMGAQVVYKLATPQTIQLTPTQVYLLYGYNTLFGDCGDISLTYDASGIIHIAEAKLDTETLKTIAAVSSDFADFKARIAAL